MSSNQSPVSGPTVNDVSYIRDLQLVMHALGDNPSPLEASAVVIEKILYQQLKLLLVKAYEVSAMRKAKILGHEDFLFLMRKDPVKIHRLLNYLAVKDLKSSATRGVVDSESNEIEPGPQRSSREQCLKFLREIDTTGALTDKRVQLFDSVKHERNVRAELMSQCLDQEMYQEYSAARRLSFNNRPGHRFFKLQEWLQSKGDNELPVLPKLKSLAYDIFCYLAYETVSQIIDLAFLVRQDAAATVNPLSYHLAGFSRRPRNYPSQYAIQVGDKEQYCAPPLTPAEIEEAVARYWSPVLYPWSAFTRNVQPQIPERLLTC